VPDFVQKPPACVSAWFGVVLDDNQCFGPFSGNGVLVGTTPLHLVAAVKTTAEELEAMVSWL
jgi:hypothetical protein